MVSRCICENVSFARIAELAQPPNGLDFEQIRERTNCCTGCGMCEPYVRLVIEQGVSSLPILSAQQCDEIMDRAKAYLAGQGARGARGEGE